MDAKFCIMCGEKMSLQAIYCQNCGAKKEISEVKEIKPEVKETHLEPEVNPIDSAPSETFDFRENDTNRGKKICETCGETVEIFSLQCQYCEGQSFRHPIPITKIDNDFKANPLLSSDKSGNHRVVLAWACFLSLIIVVLLINRNLTYSAVPSHISSIESTLANSDATSFCALLVMVGDLTSSDLQKSKTTDIARLNFLINTILARMKYSKLGDSPEANILSAIGLSLSKIETKSSDIKLYDAAALEFHNFTAQPLDPYCDAWGENLLATPTPTDTSNKVSANTQSNNGVNNCLQFQVESPYDVADFYAFQVYMTNNCSYRVSIAGNFYVKTVNGSIYERPTDAIIGFHGANICGGDSNYFNYTFNPGEQSSDSVCNSVHAGDTVVSYFIADNADGKPNLQLNGKWTLG